jgi:hypothetical protein
LQERSATPNLHDYVPGSCDNLPCPDVIADRYSTGFFDLSHEYEISILHRLRRSPNGMNKRPPGKPMTLGNVTNTEDYRRLAAQEATLAKAAITNEKRAKHYAMAAYYTRLAETKASTLEASAGETRA